MTEDDGDVKVLKRKPRVKADKTLSLLIEQGEAAIDKKEFSKARKLFESALFIGADGNENQNTKNDPYLVHRLALATYKSQKPDAITALQEGIRLLGQLDLDHTNDPETTRGSGARRRCARRRRRARRASRAPAGGDRSPRSLRADRRPGTRPGAARTRAGPRAGWRPARRPRPRRRSASAG